MDANVLAIVTALAELTDDELRALISTAKEGPQMAPGLLAWIEHAADWELHRRVGDDSPCNRLAQRLTQPTMRRALPRR